MMNAVETKKTIMELTDQILCAEKDLIDAKTEMNNTLVPCMEAGIAPAVGAPAQPAKSQDSDLFKKLDDHLYFLDLFLQDMKEITRKVQL